MTDPIQPIASAQPNDSRLPPAVEPVAPAKAQPSTRLEVSRAEEAPVYVYRVLDNETGRTLVQIPRRGADFEDDRPGTTLDRSA